MKRLIIHETLTSIYSECPYCHAQNSENYSTNECNVCNNIIDLENEIVKKSKDVIECEKLGLSGPVHKNEKGIWEEWIDPYENKVVIE